MSYALTLGANVSLTAHAAANAAANRGGASASASGKATTTPAPATTPKIPTSIPDCRDAAITGGDSKLIDNVFVDCCQKIKSGSGTVPQKIKGIAECAAKNTARGVGAAVGATAGTAICVATGVGAVAAPLCAMVGGALGAVVGGFIYERVAGYDTAQIVGGVAAAAVCAAVSGGLAAPFCGMLAAELIGWLSDSVGPIIEGIFDPGAAAERERAARKAEAAAWTATAEAYFRADQEYRLVWISGIQSAKALYKKAFTTEALQKQAKKLLGFGPVYDDLAKAFVSAGALAIPAGMPDFQEFLKSQRETGGAGCANNDVLDPKTGKWDAYSEVCPFSLHRYYLAYERAARANGQLETRDQRIAFDKQMLVQIMGIAQQIYPLIVSATAQVSSAITMVAVALKQQELAKAAENADKSVLTRKVLFAASAAEYAAKVAGTGSHREAQRAIARAATQYDIASAAHTMLLTEFFGGVPKDVKALLTQAAICASDPICARSADAVKRAARAKKNAVLNAERAMRNRLLLGGAVAVGAVGAAYLFARKS